MSDYPETTAELEEWRCKECGAKAARATREMAQSYEKPRRPADVQLLAMGISPASGTTTIPLSYDCTLECQNGHELTWEHFVL